MLKEKQNTETVITVKLTSGEEVIGKLVKDEANFMHVTRPLMLVMAEMPGSEHQTQVVFTPWMLALADDQTVKIAKAHVVSHGPAKKDAATQYEAATRS